MHKQFIKLIIMKIKLSLLLLFACLVSVSVNSQTSSSDFKIIGYTLLKPALGGNLAEVPFDKLTHINLSFLNPDKSGNFNQNLDGLTSFVEAAHSNNVKVLFSIGGGTVQPQYHELLKDDKRQKLIDDLVSNVLKYDIDGIDVDLEEGYAFGSNLDANYGKFIMELSKVLKSHNKLITVALISQPANTVTQEVLNEFDFINIMSYDHTGPWMRNSPPMHHSPYVDARDDLNFYHNTLKLPKEKLILGVPFYGYAFGPKLTDPITTWYYSDLISEYPGAECADYWHLPDDYVLFYNGIPTIKNKTKLAKKEAGGIMIWQLLFDVSGPKSLLNAIYEAAQ